MYTYRACRDTVYVYGIICIYDSGEPDGRVDGRAGWQAGPRAVSERESSAEEELVFLGRWVFGGLVEVRTDLATSQRVIQIHRITDPVCANYFLSSFAIAMLLSMLSFLRDQFFHIFLRSST